MLLEAALDSQRDLHRGASRLQSNAPIFLQSEVRLCDQERRLTFDNRVTYEKRI